MKRTKKITKNIEFLAKQLPRQQYTSNNAIICKGSDLIAKGTDAVEGKEVDPDKKYIQHGKIQNDVCHFRRLKRAYDANGFEGLKNYLTPFVKHTQREQFFAQIKPAFN